MRDQLRGKVDETARQTARDWEDGLRQSVPFEEGELRDSTRVTPKPTGARAEIDAEIGVPYAFRARQQWEEQLRRLPDRLQRTWRANP
jgi:hypothetical protein